MLKYFEAPGAVPDSYAVVELSDLLQDEGWSRAIMTAETLAARSRNVLRQPGQNPACTSTIWCQKSWVNNGN